MDEIYLTSNQIKAINPQAFSLENFIFILLLFFLVVLVSLIIILIRKRSIKKKFISRDFHTYNSWVGLSVGFQIAFMLEAVNILRKVFTEANIYIVDFIMLLLLLILWFGEEMIINSKFVK